MNWANPTRQRRFTFRPRAMALYVDTARFASFYTGDVSAGA